MEKKTPLFRQDENYWEDQNDLLNLPYGTVFSSQSYNAWKLTQPILPSAEYGLREEKK